MNVKLLEEYNELLVRYKMAMIYIDSKDIKDTEKEKFIEPFQKIVTKLDNILTQIKNNNIKYADNEVLEGFHIGFRIERYKKYNY